VARKPIITVKLKDDRRAEAAFARRVNDVQRAVARRITDNVAETVRHSIPNLGGWYRIYRDAINYYATSDGRSWIATGLCPRKRDDFPADTTLIFFERREGDDVSGLLHSYNPWTIDRLPSLLGGIQADSKARPASETEVTAQRDRLLQAAEAIKAQLTETGATFSTDLPKIQGKIYADVNFMALALERGLAGIRRAPHWTRALRHVQQNSDQIVLPISSQVQEIMDGTTKFQDRGEKMPPDLERTIGYKPNRRG